MHLSLKTATTVQEGTVSELIASGGWKPPAVHWMHHPHLGGTTRICVPGVELIERPTPQLIDWRTSVPAYEGC